jgi:hypothetical protein
MRNQRKSSRCTIPASRLSCELRLGSVVLPAMLLNESNSGFGVLVGGLPSISANQRAQLRNDRGWFDCRIVHVMEVVPAKAIRDSAGLDEDLEEPVDGDGTAKPITAADIKEFTADADGPWFRLGIRCLGRIAPPSAPATSLPVKIGGLHPMQWVKSVVASVFDH